MRAGARRRAARRPRRRSSGARRQIARRSARRRRRPARTITDSVVVSGLGVLTATVQRGAVGPVRDARGDHLHRHAVRDAARFTANGDGTYTTAPSTLDARRLLHLPRVDRRDDGLRGGDDGLRRGHRDDARLGHARRSRRSCPTRSCGPGSRICDTIRVRGLGKTPARIEVELFGPVRDARRHALRRRRRTGAATVTAQGDGTIELADACSSRTAGFYTYRERLLGAPERRAARRPSARSSPRPRWRRPPITTGRGDVVARGRGGGRRRAHADARAHRRAGHRRAGLARRHRPAATARSASRQDIGRLGWWRDGAAPGDRNGAC